jgi:hypothetical protein
VAADAKATLLVREYRRIESVDVCAAASHKPSDSSIAFELTHCSPCAAWWKTRGWTPRILGRGVAPSRQCNSMHIDGGEAMSSTRADQSRSATRRHRLHHWVAPE